MIGNLGMSEASEIQMVDEGIVAEDALYLTNRTTGVFAPGTAMVCGALGVPSGRSFQRVPVSRSMLRWR